MKFIFRENLSKLLKGEKKVRVKEETVRKQILEVRKIIVDAKTAKQKKVVLNIANIGAELGELIAREMLLANYEFTSHKTEPKEGWNFVDEVVFVGLHSLTGKESQEFKRSVMRGRIIAEEVNKTRELSNTPGGEMTPVVLAQATKDAFKGLPNTKVTVLGKKEMEKLGMGAVLGVAKGSIHEPQFIVAEYWGTEKTEVKLSRKFNFRERPIVLVGKGVTFDTGGLNIKTENYMYTMHLDMSGGAAVIHAVALAAKLGVKKNVVAIVPTVENMPGGNSYRPGDILKSMSGKTIEVLNTDAEGRVILVDALTYAKRYNPKLVIDVATLTGAACVALGERASAIFTRDEVLEKLTRELGEKSGDYVWPLPLWEEYEAEVKGTFGDVANLGKKGKMGGAIAGAVFLLQFTKDYPKDCKWMHIDMAPTTIATDDEFLSKGAKGAPVKLLLSLIESY
ncbi:MAG TPA: leucyl aminopeptidase family protein [Candidatus Paceibacterota bacterium]